MSEVRGSPRPVKPKARVDGKNAVHATSPASRGLLRPRYPAPAPRSRLRIRRRGRQPRRRSRGARADRGARDPPGLGGRLDLPLPERSPAGHRHRRRRAQAVPLPRRLAGAPGPAEVRRHGRVREGAAAAAPACRRATSADRADARPRLRARLRGAAARPRLLPDRLGVLRRGERVLRAGDDAQGARHDRGRRPDGLRLSRQERAAAPPGGARRAHLRDRGGAQAQARGRRGAARLQGGPALARRALGRHQPVPQGGHGRRSQRQGLPHLERDRAGGGGAGRVRRLARHEDRRASARSSAPSTRSRSTSATRPPCAGPPTSTRASSTRSTRG